LIERKGEFIEQLRNKGQTQADIGRSKDMKGETGDRKTYWNRKSEKTGEKGLGVIWAYAFSQCEWVGIIREEEMTLLH